MCSGGEAPGSVAEALAMAGAALDYLNGPGPAEAEAAGLPETVRALSVIGAKYSAAWNRYLAMFDANDCHDTDGYQTSAAWLAREARIKLSAARGQVRQMRLVTARPALDAAMAAGALSESWAREIIAWTRELPPEMRGDLDEVLLRTVAAGADLEDLRMLVRRAIEEWKAQRPDPEEPDDGFDDRSVALDQTFGGVGRLRGDLTAECAAALRAVLDALGKKRGREDSRTRAQRFHDGLQEACELLIRAKMVPGRAGSDTRVDVVIPLSQLRQLPGATALEDAWLGADADHHAYLTGKAAETVSCDALIVPVVTGAADWPVMAQMIELVIGALTGTPHVPRPRRPADDPIDGDQANRDADPADSGGTGDSATGDRGTGDSGIGGTAGGYSGNTGDRDGTSDSGGGWPGRGLPAQPGGVALTPEAWEALLHAMARLAIGFVSGPGGLGSVLRTGLLESPFSSRSVPIDVGWSEHVPEPIRRAVMLRDRKCRWPGGCDREPATCDVHHIKHKKDGGPTSVRDCLLLCQYHHDICIHRWGWRIELLPDGEVRAFGPLGQLLRTHGPPPRTPGPARTPATAGTPGTRDAPGGASTLDAPGTTGGVSRIG